MRIAELIIQVQINSHSNVIRKLTDILITFNSLIIKLTPVFDKQSS